MKYIRTKDGVYTYDEVKPYFLDESQNLYVNNNQKIAITEKQIIKQAYTIEELCDGFYLDDLLLKRFNRYGVFDSDEFEKFKDLVDGFKKGAIPINGYGFIKTDKGLIYVAKLNENGDLELI